MATLYVKKDGSGNSRTIQGAIPLASNGDVIMVEAGTFEENVDFYKDGITIQGAGKNQTFIVGQQQSNFTKTGCSWSLGSTTINVPAGTSGLKAGHVVTSTGIPANARIVSVGDTSFTISASTTAAKTNVSVTMAAIDSAIRWRGNSNSLKNVKVQAIQALASRAAVDQGAIYFRTAGLGATAANNYLVQDCEIEARGDSAIMCDNTGPGGGTVSGCTINGKTFVGELPAQVHAFSSLALSCNVLSSNTIELPSSEYLADVKVGSPILAVSKFIQASTTVSAINGNVLTLNKTVLDFVGTSQAVTFTNIQFNIPNVARQLVVFQPGNTSPITFTNNTISGITGGGISFNNAVTCDVVGSNVSSNTFTGNYGTTTYSLRVRGINSVVEDNTNLADPQNLGYYHVPNWSNNQIVSVGTIVLVSSIYYICTVQHTSSAANSPSGVDGSMYWSSITLEQINSSEKYGIGSVVGSNSNVFEALVQVLQLPLEQRVKFLMSKNMLKSIQKVSQDAVFSNESNWELVSFVFKKESSSQRLVSAFGDFSGEKSVKLKSGMVSGNKLELHKIIISKSDRTLLVLKRNEIEDASSLDFILQ